MINFVVCVHYKMMKKINLLNLFSQYHCFESIYIDNSILIRIDELPLFSFFINIDFDNDKVEDEFILVCDDSDVDNVLDIILSNTSFKNSIKVNSISVKIQTHEQLFYLQYDFLRVYYELYREIPVMYYSSDDDSGYCPYYILFYTYTLESALFNKFFLDKLINNDNVDTQNSVVEEDYVKESISVNFISKYYEVINNYGWQDFSEKFDLDLNNIKILTLQTKVRRLNYIKMILNLFSKSNYYPDNIFNKKIEQEAVKFNNNLMEYINSKGIIEITKTGNSSKPYVEAMISLKLLYTQNNKYQLSKYGKIFNVLNNKIEKSDDNYFDLSKFEKSFFLFFILQNDNLYLWVLIDLIYIQNNKTKIKNIKEVFQEYILNQLEFTMKYSQIKNQDKSKILTQIRRIKSWKKPQVYLEHIIEPRINWLLDLDMLEKDEFQQNYIVLSKEGLVFFDKLNSYFDIFQEKYTLMDQLRCMDFFSLASDIYSINSVKIIEDDIALIENYINESFNLFKTIAPNRVTASQAILYTCFMMLFKEDKVVNFCTIQSYLKSNKNKNFIFEWYKTENDGSIRRKK